MNTRDAFEYLQSQGLIEYGEGIPPQVLIKLIGKEPQEGWAYLGPFLQLKEYIESQGYFCTSSDCRSGGLRILPLSEMTDRV